MAVKQVSEFTAEKKKGIISLFEERKQTYAKFLVKTVLAKHPTGWKNTATLATFLPKDERTPSNETYRYPNCIVARRCSKTEEFVEFLETLVSNATLHIKDAIEVPFDGNFSPNPFNEYVESNNEIFGLEWPANVFLFDSNIREGYFPGEPFAALDAPLFPGPREVLRVWTGVDVSRYSQFMGSIVLLLPNYKARIEELRLDSNNLTVRIRTGEDSARDILGKLYCEELGGRVIQKDIDFETDSTTVPIGFLPDSWQVYIMAKGTEGIIDFRRVYASWANLPTDVSIDVGPADIEEFLRRGENEQVEFKQDVSKKPQEFLETLISFANTEGGFVFVGVDDNGVPLGFHDPKFEEWIQNLLDSHCEPRPAVGVEKKELHEKTIYVVRVAEGKNKPYNLRNRGIFVRAGSTNRPASRIEIDNMYAARGPGTLTPITLR